MPTKSVALTGTPYAAKSSSSIFFLMAVVEVPSSIWCNMGKDSAATPLPKPRELEPAKVLCATGTLGRNRAS